MARHSGESSSTKQGSGALHRISQALHGLISNLAISLKEFHDVESTLELETAAGLIVNGLDEALKPELLISVASSLKVMVGALMSDIKANAEVQKLLPAILESGQADHHASFQDLKQPSQLRRLSSPGEATPGCIIPSKRESRGLEVLCKHACEHHPELVDPSLWKTLPQELVELVFAKLPLPQIIALRNCSSELWSALSKSSNFREACAESHPKLFGVLDWDDSGRCDSIWSTMYDTKSKEWLCFELVDDVPGSCSSSTTDELYRNDAYIDSICTCDEGLVCFIPQEHLKSFPILVCNPLTNIWRALPLTPLDVFENKTIIMVQLVVEDGSKWYKVILVSLERPGRAIPAHFYDSKTGAWTSMDSDLVYGLYDLSGRNLGPYADSSGVFDCRRKMLFEFDFEGVASDFVDVAGYSIVKDRLLALHHSIEIGPQYSKKMYHVSEYTWDSSSCGWRELNVFESNVRVQNPHHSFLFASHGFLLVIDDGDGGRHENHHQQIGLYDVSANRWCVPPQILGDCSRYPALGDNIRGWFMCELRWNITP